MNRYRISFYDFIFGMSETKMSPFVVSIYVCESSRQLSPLQPLNTVEQGKGEEEEVVGKWLMCALCTSLDADTGSSNSQALSIVPSNLIAHGPRTDNVGGRQYMTK